MLDEEVVPDDLDNLDESLDEGVAIDRSDSVYHTLNI
jgi:hypothetical protein